MEAMFNGSTPKSRRILEDADVSDMFGVEVEKGEMGRDQTKRRKKETPK